MFAELSSVVILACFIPLTPIQLDPVQLVEDVKFDEPFPSSWVSKNIKLSSAKSEDKKPKKVLKLTLQDSGSPGTLVISTSSMIHLGDTVYLSLRMKSEGEVAEDLKFPVSVCETHPGASPFIRHSVKLTSTWHDYLFAAACPGMALAGEAIFSLELPKGAKSIELEKLSVQEMSDIDPGSLKTTSDEPRTKKHGH